MKYVEGECLHGPVPLSQALELAEQILDAPRTSLTDDEIGEQFAGRLLRIPSAGTNDANDISPQVIWASFADVAVASGRGVVLDGFVDEIGPRLPATPGQCVQGTFRSRQASVCPPTAASAN